MTHKLTRALLAAGATSVIALAASPRAHAGWMTGNQNPPVYTTDHPCRNGMAWSYATYVPGSWPPNPFPWSRLINGHAVVIDTGAAPTNPPNPALTVSWANSRVIPRQALTLPASFTMIPANLYALDPFGNRRVNMFDYSANFTITFNRTLGWGWPLRTQWVEPNGNVVFAAARYRVQNCWLGTVRSIREIHVRTRDPRLAIAELKPRKYYLANDGFVVVSDDDLHHAIGDSVDLVPGEE